MSEIDFRAGILAALLLALSLPAGTQQSSSEAATKSDVEAARAALMKFIDCSEREALQTPEARELLSGEALEWAVPSLGNLAQSPDKVVPLSHKEVVARVQWYGAGGYESDMYFYLTLDGGWKIRAMRRPALTGLVEQVYFGLRSKKDLTHEEEYELRNAALVLASDAALRSWFSHNKGSLDHLCKLVQASPNPRSVYLGREDGDFPEVVVLLTRLGLSGVETRDNGTVQFVIGGVLDNTVGFLFCPLNNPPPIDPLSYIWVEQVREKWFLFRTT